VGYDVSDFGAEICRRHGIAFSTELPSHYDNKYQVVICHHVLEHLPEPATALSDMSRLLIPGGRLLLYVPFERTRTYHALDPNRHLYAWDVQSLSNLASALGFTVRAAAIRPAGYEQRLALVGRYSQFAYRFALWLAQKLRPRYEIFLLAETPVRLLSETSGEG
jgi:SAM-dependent methyltransferase